MENKRFDIFDGLELTAEEKDYYDNADKVIDIIAQMVSTRIKLNISQRKLAEMTGIKQPMIARIERYDSIPRLDTLVKIASALGITLSFNKKNDSNENISVEKTTYFDRLKTPNEPCVLCEDVTYESGTITLDAETVKNNFKDCLKKVMEGKNIIILQDGKEVAKILSKEYVDKCLNKI